MICLQQKQQQQTETKRIAEKELKQQQHCKSRASDAVNDALSLPFSLFHFIWFALFFTLAESVYSLRFFRCVGRKKNQKRKRNRNITKNGSSSSDSSSRGSGGQQQHGWRPLNFILIDVFFAQSTSTSASLRLRLTAAAFSCRLTHLPCVCIIISNCVCSTHSHLTHSLFILLCTDALSRHSLSPESHAQNKNKRKHTHTHLLQQIITETNTNTHTHARTHACLLTHSLTYVLCVSGWALVLPRRVVTFVAKEWLTERGEQRRIEDEHKK